MLKHQPLGWDSDFFGFPVVSIVAGSTDKEQLSATLSALATSGVRLAYWNCAPEDAVANDAALALGARLADHKCTYGRALNGLELQLPPEQVVTASGNERDTPVLVDLALQSAAYSRFKTDPRMPADGWRRLYTTWMHKSLSGELADVTLIERVDGRPVGMVTLSKQKPTAQIGLLAVDLQQRGRGIATRLLQSALCEAAASGCGDIIVVTQGDNETACLAYERLGFARRSLVHTYHFWLE